MNPICEPVEGAPFQPGDNVKVVAVVDEFTAPAHPTYIGQTGVVEYLEYSCGCGQTYPDDPMIGVRLDDHTIREFWHEELEVSQEHYALEII